MPILAKSPSGVVTGLWGTAYIRLPNGKLKPLKVGDLVKSGEHIVTTQDGLVQITNGKGAVAAVKPITPASDVDRAIAAVEQGDEDAATAAGLTGGADGGLQPGLRVDRVSEAVGAQAFEFDSARSGPATVLAGSTEPLFTAAVVPDVNDAPFASPDERLISADSVLVIEASNGVILSQDMTEGSDVDPDVGDVLTVTGVKAGGDASGGASGGVGQVVQGTFGELVLRADGSYTYTPGAGAVALGEGEFAEDLFTYTVTDEGGLSSSTTLSIRVRGVNDAPEITDDPTDPEYPTTTFDPTTGNYSVTTPEDTEVSGRVRATDLDGDTLSYTRGNAPAHGTVTVNSDGTWTYQPNANYNGSDSFTVVVSDGKGGTATSTVSIGVTPVNDRPVAVDDSVSTPEDRSLIIDVLGNDRDVDDSNLRVTQVNGQPISVGSPVTLAGKGEISLNADGTLTFKPQANYHGDASFDYTVADPSGASDQGRVTLTVTPLSDTPVAVRDVATTAEDTAKVIDVLGNDTDADGDRLSITHINGQAIAVNAQVQIEGRGSVQLNADGTLTFNPQANYTGMVEFTYTVTDGQTPVVGNVRVDVTPVNDAPQAQDDSVTMAEEQPVEVLVRANDRDADGDNLTVTSVTQGAHGSVTINAAGNPVYTPETDYVGTDTFEYTVKDPSGAESRATVTVTVGGVNDAPVAQSDENMTGQNGTLEVSAADGVIRSERDEAGQDVDPDGDSLTVSAVGHGGVAGVVGQALAGGFGTLTLRADGSYTYVPGDKARALGEGERAEDLFSYTVKDAGGLLSTTTLSIRLVGSNDGPVAQPDRASTPEDTTVVLRVLDNDSDVDGDTLSITQINGQPVEAGTPVSIKDGAGVEIAKVTVNGDGTVTVDPQANYNGAVNFSYTVSDGTASSQGQVSVSVDSRNDPPVADNDVIEGVEDASFNFDPRANDTDPEGNALSITAINGQPISATQDVTLAQGVLKLNADGSLNFVPKDNFNGPLSFEYTVSDGQGGTDTATVNLMVKAVNDPPKIDDPTDPNFNPATGNYSVTTPEDTEVSGRVKATDLDGDTLSYTRGSAPAHGTVTVNSDGTWTYQPNANYNGSDSFTVVVSDGKGGTATSTVSIGVTPVNDPPKIDDPTDPNFNPATGNYSVTTPEDTEVSGRVRATDLDGDTLSYTRGSAPAHGTVTVNSDGTWTYQPNANYNGADSFTVVVSDGKGGTATSTVNIGVTPVNDPPKIDDPTDPNFNPATGNYSVTTPEDTEVSGRVRATDLDGDTLSYTRGSAPAHGTVTVNSDGTWTYQPNANYNGSDSFTVVVSDGKGGTATSTVSIGVTPVNDPPKIDDPTDPNFNPATGNYSVTTPEDTEVSGRVKATDLDGDTLSYTRGNAPAHGTVTVNSDGTWTYQPNANYNGSDSFTVVVSDGKGGTATSTVSIGVTPVNDPPKIDDPTDPNFNPATGNYSVTTPEDTEVSGRVRATDLDGDTLSYTRGSAPAHGTVTVNSDGTWTYQPNANYNGSDSFTVVVSDGKGGTATSTVSIGVTPVNDAPVLTAVTASVSEEGLTGGQIDSDGDPDTTDARVATGTVPATDADGTVLSGWTIEAPSTALTSGGVAVTWSGNGTQTLTATAGATTIGTLTIDNSGKYTFTLLAPLDHPSAGVEDALPLNFTVRATDGQVNSSTTLTIKVEDDSPTIAVPLLRETTVLDTNLMIILDMSSSMNTRDGVGNTTRLASAISSINTLLDKYDGLGDVRVRLITFGTNAQARGETWTTVSEARAILAGLGTTAPTNQGTNYDEALGDAMTAFASAGKLTTGQNVSYFISDGAPSFGSGTTSQLVPTGQSPGTPSTNGTGDPSDNGTNRNADVGIQSAEEAAWKTFLTSNGINSYALGVGGVTAAQRTYLDPIAYDGQAGVDRNGVVVTAFAQLDSVLGATVPAPISGNLMSGSFLPLGGNVGADDGGFVRSVTVNGITYTYNPADRTISVTGGTSAGVFDPSTSVLTITTRQPDGSVGGKFVVDMDGGDYRYEVPPAVSARDLNEVLGFVVSDRDGDTTGSTLTVHVDKPNVINGSSGADTLTGGDDVDFIGGGLGNDVLSGGGGADKLYGNDGTDTLDGGLGNDVLHGGSGADTLVGGFGNDVLIGGAGNDLLTGGAGSDVFQWQLADPGTATSTGRAVDTIRDFNPAAASAGGDVLDLRDLLSGENAGNLQNYLDFDTSTSNTVIRVSPTGGFTGGSYAAGSDTQQIVLEGVNIRTGLGLDAAATDAQIIAKLLTDGKLLVDN